MIRRLPIIPSIVVAAAVAAMIWAGVWNLKRAKLHQAQLSAYQTASRMPPVAFPTVPLRDDQLPLYRVATGDCLRVSKFRTVPGENQQEEPGYLIIADCVTGAEGPGLSVQLGWTKNPNARPNWNGGLVSGMIVPDNVSRLRLVAASPAPGLEASKAAAATVAVSPARNKGYAFQWFAFAAVALIIYLIAVRKRIAGEAP